MARKDNNHFRAGVFVLLGLVVVAGTVFVIGAQRSLFARKDTLRIRFEDASGLVVGAPVRLAGVDVGTVSGITFPSDVNDRDTIVALAIERRFMNRIRRDSVGFIDSKGLLGDKLVNVTIGSPKEAALADGAFLKTRSGYSIAGLARSLDDTLLSIGRAATSAGSTVDDLGVPQLKSELQRSLTSLSAILEAIENGPGLVHEVIYEPGLTEDLRATLKELSAAARELRLAAAGANKALDKVNSGEGTLGTLVHGEQGVVALDQLQVAAQGAASIVTEVQQGQGLLHELVYEQQSAQLLVDLATLAGRLDHIVGEVEQGRGTVGGLMMDPTVYEDLKSVIGNIERNTVFKQLIRMSIKEGEPRRVKGKGSK